MKTGIHPKYETAIVVCACGNTFETRSTRSNLKIDLCNVCHPFYTGEQRIVDTAGQVERFLKKVEGAQGQARPSKRQLRINEKASRLDEDRRRAEEAQRAAAAERAAARRAQMEAEAAANAELAATAEAEEVAVAEVAQAELAEPVEAVTEQVEATAETESTEA